MTVFCTDRNTALLVRAVLFSAAAVIAGGTSFLANAQAPIIDSTQSRSTYGQSQPSANADYGASSQLQQLQQEVMQLRGMVEEQSFQIQQLQQRQQELESRSGQAPASSVAAPAEQRDIPAAIPADNADTASEPIAADVGDEEAYRAAYALIKAQKFDQAVDAFQSFVKTYPGSRYEPNAYYWLGELYLQIQDLDASREAYTNLVEKYPDNTKVTDARYKLAKVHFLKGEKSKSRDLLKNVIASYPGTATAQAAQKFLKENF